jgi:hypothetical protein
MSDGGSEPEMACPLVNPGDAMRFGIGEKPMLATWQSRIESRRIRSSVSASGAKR